MCNAIIEFAKANSIKCIDKSPISFKDDVLAIYKDTVKTSYATFLSTRLQEYYETRKQYFLNDINNEDYISTREMREDKYFKFNAIKLS